MLNSKTPTLKPNIQLFAEGDPATFDNNKLY